MDPLKIKSPLLLEVLSIAVLNNTRQGAQLASTQLTHKLIERRYHRELSDLGALIDNDHSLYLGLIRSNISLPLVRLKKEVVHFILEVAELDETVQRQYDIIQITL